MNWYATVTDAQKGVVYKYTEKHRKDLKRKDKSARVCTNTKLARKDAEEAIQNLNDEELEVGEGGMPAAGGPGNEDGNGAGDGEEEVEVKAEGDPKELKWNAIDKALTKLVHAGQNNQLDIRKLKNQIATIPEDLGKSVLASLNDLSPKIDEIIGGAQETRTTKTTV